MLCNKSFQHTNTQWRRISTSCAWQAGGLGFVGLSCWAALCVSRPRLLYVSPHSPQTCSFPEHAHLTADCRGAKGSPMVQTHWKPLPASYLLTVHWLKQVTESSPKSLVTGAHQSKRKREVSEHLLNNIPVSHDCHP